MSRQKSEVNLFCCYKGNGVAQARADVFNLQIRIIILNNLAKAQPFITFCTVMRVPAMQGLPK
jgi:hypothetical protein